MGKKVKKLYFDLIIFSISCLFAFSLIKHGDLDAFIVNVLPVRFLAEFISGILFTSALTTPFSLAMFYVLSDSVHPIQLAAIGGLGAALGDMIIVRIFRYSLFEDISVIKKSLHIKKNTFHIFHNVFFRALGPVLGILIIASPFPDEFGLLLLGASRLNSIQLFLLTYTVNVAGIYLLATGAKLL